MAYVRKSQRNKEKEGEFEKRIGNIPETSMIEDGFEITAKVEMIIEEAKKDLFDYWRRNLIHEGLEKWFGPEKP